MERKLKICRINKYLYLIKEGKKVIQECNTYKEALNVLMSEELLSPIEYYEDYEQEAA